MMREPITSSEASAEPTWHRGVGSHHCGLKYGWIGVSMEVIRVTSERLGHILWCVTSDIAQLSSAQLWKIRPARPVRKAEDAGQQGADPLGKGQQTLL